jgi:hypothetical protein
MITMNDVKIINEVVPVVQDRFVSGQWNREQAQKAIGIAYGKTTSEEGKKLLLQIHDGIEEQRVK